MSELTILRCKSCMRYLGVTQTATPGSNWCDEACKAFPAVREHESRNLYLLYLRAYQGLSWRMLGSLIGRDHSSTVWIMQHYDPVQRKQ